MNTLVSDLLFYTFQGDVPDGWKETADAIQNAKDNPATGKLLRKMVSFASDFSLSGNVWQCWLTYMLMLHENAFSMTCERMSILPDSTLMNLAKNDFQVIKDLFDPDLLKMRVLSSMTCYKAPYEGRSVNRVGNLIRSLSEKLSNAGSVDEFAAITADYYAAYGAGKYGLYKAFRISDENGKSKLVPVTDEADVCFDDLIGLEEQKKTLRENTEAFLNGKSANNVLLYGDSGTGKSTSIHALMHDYYDEGLRLVELTKNERRLLPQVLAVIKKRNYH